MRQILIGTAMALGTLALIWVSEARAAPPPAGMLLSFKNPMIVCTKADYLKDLVAAQRTGKDEFTKKAQELLGDSSKCIAAQVSNVVTGDAEDLGTVKWDETSPMEHLWILHIGDAKAEHWALYEELEPVEVPKTSTEPQKKESVSDLCEKGSIETFDSWNWHRIFTCA